MKLLTAVLCVVAIAFVFVPTAKADDWDKKTVVTFTRPIEIPGIVLPAGTYMFQVMDFLGSRNVIRVTDADGVKVYATVFGIWNFTYDAPEDSKFTFYEAPKGAPEALHEWFYPGHRYGFEFVYPKYRAIEIAEESNEVVLAEVTPEPPVLPPSTKELLVEPIVAIEPTGEETAVAEPTPPEPEAAVAEVTPEPIAPPVEELPRTATPLALLGLIGVVTGVAAAAVRRFKG